MTAAAAAASGKVTLFFSWQGPNRGKGVASDEVRAVDIFFQGAKKAISVALPENINPATPTKFQFTCRSLEGAAEETHPETISLSADKIHQLIIKVRGSDTIVKLEVPQKLENGKRYNLVVTSNNLSLSARLDIDWDQFTVAELKSLVAEATKKQKSILMQRVGCIAVRPRPSVEAINGLVKAQRDTQSLLIELQGALKRKGVVIEIDPIIEIPSGRKGGARRGPSAEDSKADCKMQ